MIHKHMMTTLQDEEVDEIGEKRVVSGRKFDRSSPPMLDNQSRKFNQSSPIRDLSFFTSEVMAKQDYERDRRATIKTVPSFKETTDIYQMRQKLKSDFA